MLRLIVNKAKSHFNNAVELAERQSYGEALGELNDALELNARFVEALVLRGTILSRLERFEEARETWDRALALNPQAARAHRYLMQVGEARSAVPLLRRAQLVVYGAVGVAVVSLLVVVGILFATSDAEAEQRREGWEALHQGRLAEGRRVALSLDDPQSREELLSAIDRTVELKLDQLTLLALEGSADDAQRILQELRAYELTDAQRTEMRRTLDQIERWYVQRLSDLVGGGFEDSAKLDEVKELFARFDTILPERSAQRSAGLREDLARAFRAQVAGVLDPVLEDLGEPGADARIEGALGEAQKLVVLYERTIGPLKGGDPVFDAARLYASSLLDRAKAAADEGDSEGYETLIGRLETLPADVPGTLAEAQNLEPVLKAKLRAHLLEDFEGAFDAKEYDRAFALLDRLEKIYDFKPDPALAQRIDEARERQAVDSYYALMERGDAIEGGDLDEDAAKSVLRLVEKARGPMPERIRVRAEENVTFFAARAHEALGEKDAAKEEEARLRSEYPDSPYLSLLPKSDS